MQNILFFLLCALLTGCHAGTSRPELPEMVEYSGPNASSLRTFIESIEVIKLDHRESIMSMLRLQRLTCFTALARTQSAI